MTQYQPRDVDNHLSESRKASGFTEHQVASVIGESIANLRRYEAGKALPTFHTALRLEQLLGVPVVSLFPSIAEGIQLDLRRHRETLMAKQEPEDIFEYRTIYRCNYMPTDTFDPVRNSRPFKTEKGARRYAEKLKARGFMVGVWRLLEMKIGDQWEEDLDERNSPLNEHRESKGVKNRNADVVKSHENRLYAN